jgi:hypothetical protein
MNIITFARRRIYSQKYKNKGNEKGNCRFFDKFLELECLFIIFSQKGFMWFDHYKIG